MASPWRWQDVGVRRIGLVGALLAAVAAAAEPTATPRIFNGTPTGELPAVGAVGIRRQDGRLGVCSGTLIAPTMVLTAAHCLVGARTVGVVFFPTGDESVRLEMLARDFAVHPDYRARPFADIGLVFLSSPAGAILPATLAVQRPSSRRGEIVGFGVDGLRPPLVKRIGTVRLARRCPRRARPGIGLRRRDLRGSVCWRALRGGNDTCQGDSGGPLFVDGQLAAVHSGGISASPVGCPGVLSWSTDVTRFREWIDAELAREASR
jgi:trypsin